MSKTKYTKADAWVEKIWDCPDCRKENATQDEGYVHSCEDCGLAVDLQIQNL